MIRFILSLYGPCQRAMGTRARRARSGQKEGPANGQWHRASRRGRRMAQPRHDLWLPHRSDDRPRSAREPHDGRRSHRRIIPARGATGIEGYSRSGVIAPASITIFLSVVPILIFALALREALATSAGTRFL